MKILVTRTAPFATFDKALKKIRTLYPDARIYVLIQRSSMRCLSMYGNGLIPVAVKDGSFSLFDHGLSLISKIRRERFDLVVLLYGNQTGCGYLNLNLLTLMGGVRGEMIFDNRENFYKNSSPLLNVLKKSFLGVLGRSLFLFVSMVLKYWEVFSVKGDQNAPPGKTGRENGRDGNFHSRRPKRIVMVDLMFTWPPHGGACVDFRELAIRLDARGYDVKIVVPEYGHLFPRGSVDTTLLPLETHKVVFSSRTFNRVFLPKMIAGEVDRLRPDYLYLGDSYFLKPFLYKALRKHRIVSRFYTYELLCPNYYLLYRNGRKCDLNYLDHPLECVKCAVKSMKKNIQSLDFEVWSHEFMMSLAFLPSYNRVVKEALSCCETLITYNDLASSLLSPFHSDVKTFPGGVDTGSFSPRHRPHSRVKRVLVTGRLMDPRKGLGFFIENIRKLRRMRDDFEVVITHDQSFCEEYITSLGWVDHSKIKDLYNEVDICVVPSLWEEPFGMVALEAMASGKPVIASSVSGLRMSVEDGVTGLLFPSGDGEKLIEAMNTLLDDPGLMNTMGFAGRKRAENHFDWERIVDRYCDEIFERGG